MTVIIILMIVLMAMFILSCLTFADSEPEYCNLLQETCSYPAIFNCLNCPLYKEHMNK